MPASYMFAKALHLQRCPCAFFRQQMPSCSICTEARPDDGQRSTGTGAAGVSLADRRRQQSCTCSCPADLQGLLLALQRRWTRSGSLHTSRRRSCQGRRRRHSPRRARCHARWAPPALALCDDRIKRVSSWALPPSAYMTLPAGESRQRRKAAGGWLRLRPGSMGRRRRRRCWQAGRRRRSRPRGGGGCGERTTAAGRYRLHLTAAGSAGGGSGCVPQASVLSKSLGVASAAIVGATSGRAVTGERRHLGPECRGSNSCTVGARKAAGNWIG